MSGLDRCLVCDSKFLCIFIVFERFPGPSHTERVGFRFPSFPENQKRESTAKCVAFHFYQTAFVLHSAVTAKRPWHRRFLNNSTDSVQFFQGRKSRIRSDAT